MAHPTDIQATHHTALMVSRQALAVGSATSNALAGIFSGTPVTGVYELIEHVRDFPAVGAPANLINVPEYGRDTTLSISAQSDSQAFELTLNFAPNQWLPTGNTWATTGSLEDLRKEGAVVWFQLAMMGQKPASYDCKAAGLGTVPNSLLYFQGRIASMEWQPARDDAATATVSISRVSDYFGLYTMDPM